MNDVLQPGRPDEPLLALMQAPCAPVAHPVQASGRPAASVVERAGVMEAESVADVPPEFYRIWAVLESHFGQAAAITAPAIAEAAGLWPDVSPVNRGTRVRKVLELAQDVWPWPVCGDNDVFYLAASADDLNHYIANLNSRLLCLVKRLSSVGSAARRVGFVDLGHGRFADRQEAPISPHVG